jgi:alkaline phosphatase
MLIKNFNYLLIAGLLFSFKVKAQTPLSYNQGHSHNDYHQKIPLLTAYGAEMGSIEADVFLKNGQLYVAHDTSEIKEGITLKKLYLEPLANFYAKNGNRPYKDSSLKLQLVIDVKEDHQHVLPQLIEELKGYQDIFNSTKNPKAVRIVLSGDMPAPSEFKNYPDYISFDGRPNVTYTEEQLKRIAMISDALKSYTAWKGKEVLTKSDEEKLKAVIAQAHQKHKPFRFWATPDSAHSWIVLEKLGADWINTDQPAKLREFYQNRK